MIRGLRLPCSRAATRLITPDNQGAPIPIVATCSAWMTGTAYRPVVLQQGRAGDPGTGQGAHGCDRPL